MCVREAVNHVFVVVVARARVPCHHLLRLWAELHHTLRHRSSWERAPAQRARLVGLRPDERIDKFRVIICILRKHKKRQNQGKKQSEIFFHSD